jgi:hypothetical protein
MEKRWADSMEHIVKTQYRTGEYVDEAERTVSTAYAELVWAEDSVRNVRKAINTRNAVEALQYKVRQAWYDTRLDVVECALIGCPLNACHRGFNL